MTIRSPEDLAFFECIDSNFGSNAGGYASAANGTGSVAWGERCLAVGRGSIALGIAAVTHSIGEVVISGLLPLPTDLLFQGEHMLFMACEVMVSIGRVGFGEPHETKYQDLTDSTLECWCGWSRIATDPHAVSDMTRDFGIALDIARHERSGSSQDEISTVFLLSDARAALSGLGFKDRQFSRVNETELHHVERLFRAYKLAGKPLPMVTSGEDAARLLVWCDRLLLTVALRHVWWIEQWIRAANKLLGGQSCTK